MQEVSTAHHAFARAVAVDDPVDVLEELRFVDDRLAADLRRCLRDRAAHFLDAVGWRRVRRQPVGDTFARAARFVEARERIQHAGDAGGIPTGPCAVFDAERIRLPLVISPVLEEQQAEAALGEAAERTRLGDEDAEQREPDAGARRFRVLLRGMARRHVADLVSEHTRELRFVVEKRHDPAREIDVSAGQRKRVDRGRIDDGEMPGKVRAFGRAREAHADVLHVPLERFVLINAHLLADFPVHLLPDLNFLRFAHQREFAISRRGIGRAAHCKSSSDNDRREDLDSHIVLRGTRVQLTYRGSTSAKR
jgi:hypothetical protein